MMYLDSMTLMGIVTGITRNTKRVEKIRKASGWKRLAQIEQIDRYLCAECAAHRVKLTDEEKTYCIHKVLDYVRHTA